jgi:hypothetical protein
VEKESLAAIRVGYREFGRTIKHGPSYFWRRYVAPVRDLKGRTIHTDESGDVTVCVITCRKDWLACLWSLVSFYELSGLRLPLLIYSDGTLGAHEMRSMATVFPEARLISSTAGAITVSNRLSGYPNCLRFRTLLRYALKLTDLPILCGSPRILILDSDVLFLKRPDELMMHLGPNWSERFVFERDARDSYIATRAEIKRMFNVDVPPRVNSGIMIADVSAFEYSRIEKWLGNDPIWIHPWGEQTLWAMYAGQERTAFLSEEYDVTEEPHLEPNKVAKHYIKPIRDFMYMEGIPHLIGCLAQGPSSQE